MKDAPDRIWAEPSQYPGEWTATGSQVTEFDVEYIRADLARPKVKPGELERIVWSAMVWARENPGPDEVPEYSDGGNSFAESECRATVRRILEALE